MADVEAYPIIIGFAVSDSLTIYIYNVYKYVYVSGRESKKDTIGPSQVISILDN